MTFNTGDCMGRFDWTQFLAQLEYMEEAGVSKWAGTRYFYLPEIVYSTGRNY
jgi:hypothetical protein